MGNVNELLSLAQKQVGNGGADYWNWYADNLAPWLGHYIDGYSTPYCAIFDSCMLLWTNTECDYFPSTVAFDKRDWTSNFHDKFEAQAGDMVSFDWDYDGIGDHVGIVKSVHDWGIVTIEGNSTNSLVCENQRVWDNIICVIRPYYESEDSVTEADKKDIARMCAEYVWGETDRKDNLNMYNATHWGYRLMQTLNGKLDELIGYLKEKLG